MKLESVQIYAGEAEPTSYLDSHYELHSYLKMPFDCEAGSGTVHIGEDMSVYLQMDGEECPYAMGVYQSDPEITAFFVQEVCQQLSLNTNDLSDMLFLHNKLQTHILEAADEKGYIRKEEQSPIEALYEEAKCADELTYDKKDVVEFFYAISKEAQSGISLDTMQNDREAFNKAVILQNFGSYITDKADEHFPEDSPITNADIKSFARSIHEETSADYKDQTMSFLLTGDKKMANRASFERAVIDARMEKLFSEDIDKAFPKQDFTVELATDKSGNPVVMFSDLKQNQFTFGIGKNEKPYVMQKAEGNGKPHFINTAKQIPEHTSNYVKDLINRHMDLSQRINSISKDRE